MVLCWFFCLVTDSMPKLILLDGHSLLNRAFYAVDSLTSAKGVPTHAVYGFFSMLHKLTEDQRPDLLYVVFDRKEPTFRHKEYEDYKKTRKPMPEELRTQIPLTKELLDALGIPRMELAGYEADDLLGTLAKKGEEAGYEVVVVTGDNDALQLISDTTTVLLTKTGVTDTEVMSKEALFQKLKLTPKQIPDYKGLKGDSSDNIPGVPSIGEKRALALLWEYPSLESIYEHIECQKGNIKEKLMQYRDQAFLSRRLATIDCGVPLSVDFDQIPKREDATLFRLLDELGLASLMKSFQVARPKKEKTEELRYFVLEKEEESFLVSLKNSAVVTLEYTSLDGEDSEVVFDLDQKELWLLPSTVFSLLEEKITALMQDKVVVFWQVKPWYLSYGKELPLAFDISLAVHLLEVENTSRVSLAQRYDLFVEEGTGREKRVADARLGSLLYPLLKNELAEKGLLSLLCEIEVPLAFILAKMEKRGILLRVETLSVIREQFDRDIARLTEEIYKKAGETFNLNSPKQLAVILFDKLGLPVVKKNKTGPSTNAEVLEKLSYVPIVEEILEYRGLAKLQSTYTDSLAALINPKTKRIHTTYNQGITATGRLSSTQPNLQNIPIRTKEGRSIRSAFVADLDQVLLAFDYSQIELRVLAHLSEDEALIQAFHSGLDIHTQTASEVMGVPLDLVTKEQRSAAKAVNFGIVYGMSSFGLSKGIHQTLAKSKEYIDTYFARYPKVKSYLDDCVEQAKKRGYVTTLLDRRRHLPDINNRIVSKRAFAERMAMNTPIQGSAADIIKLAMLQLERSLPENEGQMLLQVHDELVFEVPKNELLLVAKKVKTIMEGVLSLRVPLVVDVKAGDNLRDLLPVACEEV